MTDREKAIDLLDNLIGMVEDNHNSDYDKALKMAIKSLEQEPILDKIREIVDEWKSDTWTDNLSYECMIKIAKLFEP